MGIKKSRQLDKFDTLREQAEERLSHVEEKIAGTHDLTEMFHELRIHQKELELQNVELQETQEELTTLYKEYSDLYEFAPNGYLTINPKGIITNINLTGTKMLGLERSMLYRSALTSFIWKESLSSFYKTLQKAKETGYPQKQELKLITHSRTEDETEDVWVQVDIVADMKEQDQLRQFRLTLTDITDRVQAEKKVQRLLSEKKQLLQEVHHRIKNHMLSLSSILSFQISQNSDPIILSALRETKSRFDVMQYIYSTLYNSNDVGTVDIDSFIRKLISSIKIAHLKTNSIKILTKIENLAITAKQSFPIGIMINETINNALKYAFPEGSGEISITIEELESSYLKLRVTDNGRGMFQEEIEENNYGFGLTLISMYAKQFDGYMEIESKEGEGTTIVVVIELEKPESS